MTSSRVGRILLEPERAARMADEAAAGISGEGLRSAFAISAEHILTAWHCVRDASARGDRLWFRLRVAEAGAPRRYAYLPVRVLAENEAFDVAVLEVERSLGEVERLLADSVIPLGLDVSVHEQVRVMGFPANAPSADSDTLPARVVDLTLPLGEVTGLKLLGESFAAVDPVNPHGLSGGPVLKDRGAGIEVAVGVVRGVPVGRYADTALGGGLIATRIEDIAGLLPEVAAALLADAPDAPVVTPGTSGPAQWADTSLSGLLRADAELVDFLGRDRELRELRSWCDEPAMRAAWLVTGPGGQGKTRLARQLCSALTGTGKWASAMLHGPGDAAVVQDLCRRAAAADRSLLLVADYAAEYGAAAFAELVAVLTGDPARLPRWRLLLLARNTGTWWEPQISAGVQGTAVRPQLLARGVEVPAKELALTPLVPDPQERAAAFSRILSQLCPAVMAAASARGMTVADPPVAPDLSGAAFGSALMLHVAAIVALLPPVGGALKPGEQPSATDLINRILDLEAERHWLYADSPTARLYRPTEVAFGDLAHDPTAVETAVAAATLAGAPTAYDATRLVTRALEVDQARARIVARWLHNLYPQPEGGSEDTWLPPLQPDRLGEELVARVIRRQQADGTPPGQLLPRRILGSRPDSLAAVQVHRLLTVMIRTGSRDRDIADLLADAGGHGGLLGAISGEIDLTVVEGALPQTNTNLLGPATAVTEHVIRHYDFTHTGWRELDPHAGSNGPILAQGARLLSRLASRLINSGQPDDAVAAAQQAVEIQRRLAHANPATYQPDLAASLNNLANGLLRAGQREEALAAANEAVEIRRRLVEANPAAYLPSLAETLSNAAVTFSELGRAEEALEAANEAVNLYRRLAERNPAAYLDGLATSLINLVSAHADVGRQEEALAAANEAADLYRRLTERDPAAYLHGLAVSLNNVGVIASRVGHPEEALGQAREAADLYRRLADANPAAYQPELAGSLGNLGTLFLRVGRREDALAMAKECADLYRRLADASPAAYLPDVAASLTNLGTMLRDLGRLEEALPSASEAVDLYRRLAERNPAAYRPRLAVSLANLGGILRDLGRLEEALPSASEAVDLLRRLTETSPATFLSDLAAALTNLVALSLQLGPPEEAQVSANEAVDLYRRLAEGNPVAYRPGLAMSLANLGASLEGLGRPEEALAATGEAIEIYRPLAAASPVVYLPDLARSLANLAGILNNAGQWEEALAPAREATHIYRSLAAASPVVNLPGLARALSILGASLNGLGRPEEALAPAGEAAGLYRRLAETSPAVYLPDLATSLDNLGMLFTEVGRAEEALALAWETTGLYRRLAETDPAVYLPDLARSLASLATGLADTGRAEEADKAWEDTLAQLGPASDALRRLRVGWEWVLTPTYEAERDHLTAHPELLAPGSEDLLRQILPYLQPEEAGRYLSLLETARAHGIAAAYRDVQ